MMGSLHPAGALYEKPVNIRRARDAHGCFVAMLRRKGATVLDVRDVLRERVDWSVGDRLALENLAFTCLTYAFHNRSLEESTVSGSKGVGTMSKSVANDAEQYYVSDQYKRKVIEEMGQQQLVDIIFTNPTVTVSPSPRDTGFTASYHFDPLSNIMFVRDQQITTKKGIVMARLSSKQRHKEVDIMEFCFKKLGLNVIGRIPFPGCMEGGDFFPVGENLCLIGTGPRSDITAVQYLLKEDLLGTRKVAVVKDQFEKRQERMHLDTVFNILSDDCCVMLEDMMGVQSSTRRIVDEYIYEDSHPADTADVEFAIGKYVLRRKDVEFATYMTDQGFKIIPVSGEEQLNYGCNILNLGGGNIISIEKNTARRIASSSNFRGTVEYLDFSPVTSMYGGVHCASQVVLRDATSLDASKRMKKREQIAVPTNTFADDIGSGSS